MDENLRISYEEQERRKGAAVFAKLGMASFVYTVLYTVCLYKNTMGVATVFWVMALIGYAGVVFHMFGIKGKRDSIFIAAVMGLLGVSTFLTGNEWIIWMNYAAIFVLSAALLLHNFAQDEEWDIGKYITEITVAFFGALGCIAKPFTDGSAFYRSRERHSTKNGYYILIGIAAAIPCLLFLGIMLMSADMVFADMVGRFFKAFRFPARVFGVIFMLCFGFFSSYCGVRYVEKHSADVTVSEKREAEPLIAVAFTVPIAMLYAVFSVIQIAYLFVGGMKLPDGVTYAEYARKGFFQLLFVCVLNLILVLVIQKYFRENSVLKVLLLVISGCTFIMTASSACRMVLYIRTYQLTFLRVSVLVALGVIALLMVGIVGRILIPRFPLFRFGIVVVCVAYLAFSFSHVDYFIAAYNLSHPMTVAEENRQTVDYGYIYTLSTDAAPAIARYMRVNESAGTGKAKPEWYVQYCRENENVMEDITLRNFNLSHFVAQKLLIK